MAVTDEQSRDRWGHRRRLKNCVEQWPDCEGMEYHPSCCRFPKSCSCTSYMLTYVNEEDLEDRWVARDS